MMYNKVTQAESASILPDYEQFVRNKVAIHAGIGFAIEPHAIHPVLKPHQRDIVLWALRGGRRAVFASFGLGKTIISLEILRQIGLAKGGRMLIVAPLGVRQEFKRDGRMLDLDVRFIRRIEECDKDGIYITNYETVRDGKLDPTEFTASVLDEAACLRGFGGSKTFREFMRVFQGIPYKFVATATPSPNEYIELLAYSAYLEIMDVGEAKTRFFKRNSEKADKLTIHPHKEREFWLWVASWGIFVNKPSDLGHSDDGYLLPEMRVHYHEVRVDHETAGYDSRGQKQMFREATHGVVEASRERRESLPQRLAKAMDILDIDNDPSSHYLIWHDLERERDAIERAIPRSVSIYGSQDLDDREQAIIDFSDGKFQYLAAKPVIAGSGCNFQRHCHKAIFLGIGFKFADFIQAIHRIHRFLQEHPVEIHIIYAESERAVLRTLQGKWARHCEMVGKMTEIIEEYGLSEAAMAKALERGIGIDRVESSGRDYTLVNNDTVLELQPGRIEDDSVGLVLTSIPFSTQYEYTPSYNDFGHTDSNGHFWQQMDYLTPNLLRVLMPGRLAIIHVKDRVVPGGMTGLGFQTVYPFHVDAILHFQRHGFAYMGMKTIVTDVVRENNQTYRLGWTEQCKDGSKMGVGMPEYLLLFRKPPTSADNSYADNPVVKSKHRYTRSRWQIDAHAFTRSNGNRLMLPDEIVDLPHDVIFKLFRDYNLQTVYDFEHHVRLGEQLEGKSRLPVTFMLLQPPSWSDEVWTDVARMLSLNLMASQKGKEMHLCPMQFDIADRCIEQFSNAGEIILDPFSGLGTVPYRAIRQGRKGYGVELNHRYWFDAVAYCQAAEQEMSMPDMFAALADDSPVDVAA